MKTLILGLLISLFSFSSFAMTHNSAELSSQPFILSVSTLEAQFAKSVNSAVSRSVRLNMDLTYELIIEAVDELSEENQLLVDDFLDEFFSSRHAIALDQNMTELLGTNGALTKAIIGKILAHSGYSPDDGIVVACADPRNPFCR